MGNNVLREPHYMGAVPCSRRQIDSTITIPLWLLYLYEDLVQVTRVEPGVLEPKRRYSNEGFQEVFSPLCRTLSVSIGSERIDWEFFTRLAYPKNGPLFST